MLKETKTPLSDEGNKMSSDEAGDLPVLDDLEGPALVSITVSQPGPGVALAGGFTPYCGVGVEVHIIAYVAGLRSRPLKSAVI